MVFCKCEYCGKEFNRNPAELKKAKKHYCSRSCKKEAQKQVNDVIIEKEFVKVLCRYKSQEMIVLLDFDDYSKCSELGYKIIINKKLKDTTYYAKINGILLHRFIMNCPKNKIVDHINHNGLDNRKCNLRICTYEINNRNRNTKSEHKGVYWNKKMNKWKAELEKNNKNYFGGYFENLKDAIKARKELEKKYWQ